MSDYSDLSGFSKINNGRKLYYVTKMLKKNRFKVGSNGIIRAYNNV